jgi:hypothetical protein
MLAPSAPSAPSIGIKNLEKLCAASSTVMNYLLFRGYRTCPKAQTKAEGAEGARCREWQELAPSVMAIESVNSQNSSRLSATHPHRIPIHPQASTNETRHIRGVTLIGWVNRYTCESADG